MNEHIASLYERNLITSRGAVILALYHSDLKSMPMADFVTQIGIRRSNLTMLMKRLEKAGLVTQTFLYRDNRRAMISLTPKGRSEADSFLQAFRPGSAF